MKHKKLCILSLLCLIAFTAIAYAGINNDVKSSPLFSHSLQKSIDAMENQGSSAADSETSAMIPTSNPVRCAGTRSVETTAPSCETFDNTCEGNETCYGSQTCIGATCNQSTCLPQATCAYTCTGETCQATCSGMSTCSATCATTCSNCPATVSGNVVAPWSWYMWNSAYYRNIKLRNILGQTVDSSEWNWLTGYYSFSTVYGSAYALYARALDSSYGEMIGYAGFIQNSTQKTVHVYTQTQ